MLKYPVTNVSSINHLFPLLILLLLLLIFQRLESSPVPGLLFGATVNQKKKQALNYALFYLIFIGYKLDSKEFIIFCLSSNFCFILRCGSTSMTGLFPLSHTSLVGYVTPTALSRRRVFSTCLFVLQILQNVINIKNS